MFVFLTSDKYPIVGMHLYYLLKHVQKLLPRIHFGVLFVVDETRMHY